jgi:GNAT superfamily N-acetyltransferase
MTEQISTDPGADASSENKRMSIRLREVTPDDEPFLFEVYASTRVQELEGLGWDENQKQDFIRMQFVTRERSFPRVEDRIVLSDGRSIGRLAVDRTEKAIWLRDIALLTEYRNAGIGSGLIKDLMDEAAVCGKPLMLHVLFISQAVRLYERLGFSTTGSDAGYLEMTWLPPSSITSEE